MILIDEGNPNLIDIGDITLLNLPKYHLLSKSITNYLSYQSLGEFSVIQRQEPLYTLLQGIASLSRDDLFTLSEVREPRKK